MVIFCWQSCLALGLMGEEMQDQNQVHEGFGEGAESTACWIGQW